MRTSVANMDKVAKLHIASAAWNMARFAACNPLDGFSLTYFPFAAGTSLTLAAAPPRIRAGQAVATMIVCIPHLMSELGAQIHFGGTLLYLVGSKHVYNWWGEPNHDDKDFESSMPKETMPFGARLLSGLLALSQTGISILFTSNYLLGDVRKYEAFLTETLTATDKVPSSTLTPVFLRGAYLAGSYVVLGTGWSIAGNLTKAVVQNSAPDCQECLQCFAMNLSTQVALHTIGYLTHFGGDALGDYMYVHGPMSAPVLAMILGTWCLALGRPNEQQKKE
eukprot:CAMPEP_0197463118 /NCGR_PEP_ID=MMETSP1175-20131217/60965_1 /TAXON_ID=1003142 /ORGANISM="Triceratium dubium, Strain CCMP147" /LENGTH=278 /DNA_ID=CAMNT_0042998797 /DNA_START=44 /DNA_END=880 /DNA_ORIENTATION=-